MLGGGGRGGCGTGTLVLLWAYQASDTCSLGVQGTLGSDSAWPCLGGQQRCPWEGPLTLQSNR